jgi:endo-1,4-beta-mannosidase
MTQPFVLGVNYWPRRKAMYWWGDFDLEEVREEFGLIQSLGLQIVRIFLLWDDFQPEPDRVDPDKVADLVRVADVAAELGLGLDVTFFTGHMSGPNWSPRWLLDGPLPPYDWIREVVSEGKVTTRGYRNMFHDPMALDAARLLLQTVVGRLKDHPAIWMWNLGNEPELFAWPDTAEAGRAWVREMTQLIKGIDPNHPVTCGLDMTCAHQDTGLRVDQVYAETDVAVMHSYPMYTPWSREPLDPDFVPFTCAFTAAMCGKPVLMEEFGGCTAQPGEASHVMAWTETGGRERTQFMASEEDLAEFLRQTLPRLQDSGATGAMVWCFADYAPELWDRPPCLNVQHERFFGLVRPDGTVKPHARVMQEFAQTRPEVKPIPAYAQMTVDPDAFYEQPLAFLPVLYEGYLERLAGREA